MTIEDFMKAVKYRITDGSDFCWSCFGTDAQYLNSDTDDYGSCIVYDRQTQVIYCAEAHDYVNERSYRWTNPDYADAHRQESKTRDVDLSIAWDHVKFVDLETEEDFLIKCSAIVDGRDYDTRVTVPVDLDDDEIFTLMKMAHDRDITLNQLVEVILTEVIKKNTDLA